MAGDDIRTALTVRQVAERYGVSVGTLYRWRQTGEGPRSFKIGGQVRYRLVDVEAYEHDVLAGDAGT